MIPAMRFQPRWILALGLTASVLVGVARAETVVLLVRHGEKVDESRDPELSDAGRKRASALASFLKDTEIDAIYSTDYIRTRDTARPTSDLLGVPVEIYAGDDLVSLAGKIRARSGRFLVVGHSNTTTELVRALGGDPGAPIASDEYDRLYVVVLGETKGEATTLLLRMAP
jgi:phosphohistidine phosphatase SixA